MDEIFNDLPEAPELEQPVEPELIETDPKEEENEIQKLRQLVKEKDQIAREERERRKKLSEENRRLKEAKPEEKKPEEPAPEEPSAEPGINAESIAASVKETLKREQYEEQAVKIIKSKPGITRAEAKAVYDIFKKLPQTGDTELDVDFAFDYHTKLNTKQQGFVPPSPSSGYGSFRAEQSQGGATRGAVEMGKKYGLKEDDFKKYGGEIKL